MAWAGPEGRQLGEKGLAELGDKLAGDVCRALSTGLPASGHAWACCSCRKISRGNSWVPLPGRWHQWVHCLLEGMAGVADPLLELMTFQKQKSGGLVGRKLSLVQTLPRGSRVCFSLRQEGPLSLPAEGPLPRHPS